VTPSALNFVPGDQVTDALGEVVVDPINVIRKRPRSRAGREAREWLASRDASWPFAYERICEALDLDPDRVRREIAGRAPAVRLAQRPFELPDFLRTASA
jgi:hypothetical protein